MVPLQWLTKEAMLNN